MQTRHVNVNVLDRFRALEALIGICAAAAIFVAATMTGSAAPYPGNEFRDTSHEVTMEQDDSTGARSLDDESDDVADESPGSAGEQFIPGDTDVLDAELGIWWLEGEETSDHPARPDSIGPYK
jgi:hypothetical protein